MAAMNVSAMILVAFSRYAQLFQTSMCSLRHQGPPSERPPQTVLPILTITLGATLRPPDATLASIFPVQLSLPLTWPMLGSCITWALRKGVASALIRGALDDVRAGASRRARPLCPFVKAFIQRHEDYQDLLYAGDRLA